jgi:ATP-dependent Clp protease ATP-binding subunit ClpA
LPKDIEKYPDQPEYWTSTIENIILWKDTVKQRVCDNCYIHITNIKKLKNLINMFEIINIDIIDIYNIILVCKSWNKVGIYLLSKFREIQYKEKVVQNKNLSVQLNIAKEINSKFLSFISNLPDPISKQDLKRNLINLVPMSKIQNITDGASEFKEFKINYFTPKEIYDELSKIIIGQETAKKTISVSIINHLKSLENEPCVNTHSDKHHVLMLGESGSGKTLMANSLANFYDLPFVTGDATNYSPTGFQGADTDSVVHDLLLTTDMNFELSYNSSKIEVSA